MAKDALYLLDTNVLFALVRGKELGRYVAHIYRLSEVLWRPMISIVSHRELMAMAKRHTWGTKKWDSLNSILDNMVTIDLNDPAILDAYVEVDVANMKAEKAARVLSNNDMWIAATICAADAISLTTDKDFLHPNPHICKVEYIDPESKLPQGLAGKQQRLQ